MHCLSEEAAHYGQALFCPSRPAALAVSLTPSAIHAAYFSHFTCAEGAVIFVTRVSHFQMVIVFIEEGKILSCISFIN